MTTPEGRLKNQLLALIKGHGGYCLKTEFVARSGCPDWLVLLPLEGRFFWVELKRPGGKVSVFQKLIIDVMQKSGIPVFIADSIEEIKEKCGL